MAPRSLRAQLNQIRAWVREGRTDAWIAHQLEVATSELRDFRKRHALAADSEPDPADDLRDEIEAEVEAATLAAEDEDEDQDQDHDEDEDEDGETGEEGSGDDGKDEDGGDRDSGDGDGQGRKRRRRRGGRGRGRARRIEASFDHGEKDGYGLWLDASVKDNPTYKEYWAGHRDVDVAIEADQIIIRRSGGGND